MLDRAVAPLAELIGSSPAIVAVREQVERLLRTWTSARRPPPVLIQGETGTGKGLLARAIHRASPRAQAPFVDINCAAVPETLLEAELFGYERGAFTDAKQSKPGLFQLAHRGTLFLDEVGLLPPALQAKLLSVLEERSVRRLGATRAEPVDVWVIAATNEDLALALRERRFRDDLYHRVAVVSLALPPLRARGEDIVLLAEHFLERACGDYGLSAKRLSSGARHALTTHEWRGNVRELSNVIERAALLADATMLEAEHLALGPGTSSTEEPLVETVAATGTSTATPSSSRDAMREHLERVLAQTSWNISRTAALLGVSRNTVMARIARFGLRGPRKAGGARAPERTDAAIIERPAPSALPAPTSSPAHWERRRLTFVRVAFPSRGDAELEPSNARALEIAGEKLRAFGARVDVGGPAVLFAVFGLDERDEPAVLAGHGALVVRNAARQGLGEGATPALRVSIHTAEVLVRAGAGSPTIDADGARESWNAVVAAMQLAAPGTIVTTTPAAELLRRRFALTPIGSDPVTFRIEGLGRTEPGPGGRRTVFVGRREELALLQARLSAATDGRGQAVNLVGDAGMGKSRLITELTAGARSAGVRYVEGRCMPSEVQTPFAPLLQIVRDLCGIAESDAGDAIAAKVGAALAHAAVDDLDVRDDLVHLLDASSASAPLPGGPRPRVRLFGAIRRMITAESVRAPLLLVVEDLHWIDPSSEACLSTLVDAVHDARILLIASYRPGYHVPWSAAAHVMSLALAPLSDEESVAVIRGVFSAGAGSAAAEASIKARAEGNPLFLEELSRGVVERRDAVVVDVRATIDDAIAGRLARLGPRPRRVVSALAIIGRDTPATLARAILELPDDVFHGAVDQLCRADFLHETSVDGEPGYTFRHALVQEVAYARVPPVERRALHVRVLDTMERLYPDRGADHVERLAHHAVLGDAHERAVTYLLQAAEKAAARTALAEALVHCERGLSLVPRVPASAARDRVEFDLENTRARVLMATKGYAAAETERAYARARECGERIGDAMKLGPVLVGQWAHFLLKAEYERARAVAEELRTLAPQDPLTLAYGHLAIGMTELFRGELAAARQSLELAIEGYEPRQYQARAIREYGGPPHAASLAYLGRTLSLLGFLDQARRRGEEAVAQAQRWNSPLGVAQCFGMLTNIHASRRDMDAAWETGEKTLAYATDKGIAFWVMQSTIFMAWVRGVTGASPTPDASIEDIRRSIERYCTTDSVLGLAEYLMLLAEVYAAAGRVPEALAVIDEAERHAEATGLRYLTGDLRRLRGDLLLTEGPASFAAAETCFRDALAHARAQDARTFELRAATSLARLLQRRGAQDDAHRLLAPIYGWFTEGLETADLRAARAVLDATASQPPS